jgi:hypothetical protein
MATITEAYSGSASIGTTEYSLPNASTSLTPITADGVYQAFIDLAAMAAGDQYTLRVYERARSGDPQRVIYKAVFTGVQAYPLVATPSLMLIHGWDMTLDKDAGTDRTITWSIRTV